MKNQYSNGDILNARGDIFNANGNDIFPSGKVLIKGNKKNMLNSTGDIFDNATGPNPFLGKTQAQVDTMLEGNPSYYDDPNFTEWYQEYAASQASAALDKSSSSSGLERWVNNILGWTDESADIINKFKSGTSVDSGGINTTFEPGSEVKSNNTIYWIAGGVVVALIIVGIVISRQKK